MAQVGLSLDFSGYTGQLLVVCKKATSPLTEVARSAALSFPVVQVITFPNLTDETYIFEFWQSSNGTSLDTLLRSWSIDASAFTGGIAQTFEYQVDRGNSLGGVWADPVDGAAQISDTRLYGAMKGDLLVYREGQRPLRQDEYTVSPTGGIALNVLGDRFTHNETIIITWFRRLASSANVSSDYSDIVTFSANKTYASTDKNKLLVCTSSAAKTIYTLPAVATLPDQKLRFSTHGMTGNNLSIQLNGAETVLFRSVAKNVIHLGQGEALEILVRSNVYYILQDETGNARVGRREMTEKVGVNQRLLDGAADFLIADYPRISEYILSLPTGTVISVFATWDDQTNWHKWYYNAGAGIFRFPNDQGMHYRAIYSSETVLRYQDDMVGPHTHGGVPLKVNDVDRGGGSSSFSIDNVSTTDVNTGVETRVKNVGLLAVVNI